MARSVRDAAILFSAMIGSRPGRSGDGGRGQVSQGLRRRARRRAGSRACGSRSIAPTCRRWRRSRFEEALGVLKAQGAVLVDVDAAQDRGHGRRRVRRAQVRAEERSRQISRRDAAGGEDAHARSRSSRSTPPTPRPKCRISRRKSSTWRRSRRASDEPTYKDAAREIAGRRRRARSTRCWPMPARRSWSSRPMAPPG